jgi:hypothetical protein
LRTTASRLRNKQYQAARALLWHGADGALTVPGDDAQLGETRFEDWLRRSASQLSSTNPQPQQLQLLRKEPVDLKDNGFRESEMLRQKRENAKA